MVTALMNRRTPATGVESPREISFRSSTKLIIGHNSINPVPNRGPREFWGENGNQGSLVGGFFEKLFPTKLPSNREPRSRPLLRDELRCSAPLPLCRLRATEIRRRKPTFWRPQKPAAYGNTGVLAVRKGRLERAALYVNLVWLFFLRPPLPGRYQLMGRPWPSLRSRSAHPPASEGVKSFFASCHTSKSPASCGFSAAGRGIIS